MSDRYAAIQAHRDRLPVRLMCALLEVSPSGFYDARAREAAAPSEHAVADERLRVHVRAAHRRSRGRYGAPRVQRELGGQGIAVAKKRVARLMREDGLVGRRRPKFVRTTDSDHADPIAPNLLGRRFSLVIPVAICCQNRRSTSRRREGAPGDRIPVRPVISCIHPAGRPINTPMIEGVATTG